MLGLSWKYMYYEPCTVLFAPSAERPPKAPTMKYWNILLPVSPLEDLYLPKLGITVVSCSFLVPRWKGETNSACEVEASVTAFRRWTAVQHLRAGNCCRAVWRTSEVAALAGRAIALVVYVVVSSMLFRIEMSSCFCGKPGELWPNSVLLTMH